MRCYRDGGSRLLTKRPASLLWILTNVLISLRRRRRASRKSFDFRFPKFTLSSHPLHSQFSPTTGRPEPSTVGSGVCGGALRWLFDFFCLFLVSPFLRGFLLLFLLFLLMLGFFVLSVVVIWWLFNRTLCRTRFLSHEHSTNSPIEQALAIVKAMPAAVIAFTNAVSRVSKRKGQNKQHQLRVGIVFWCHLGQVLNIFIALRIDFST